jgi:hypothetical protein
MADPFADLKRKFGMSDPALGDMLAAGVGPAPKPEPASFGESFRSFFGGGPVTGPTDIVDVAKGGMKAASILTPQSAPMSSLIQAGLMGAGSSPSRTVGGIAKDVATAMGDPNNVLVGAVPIRAAPAAFNPKGSAAYDEAFGRWFGNSKVVDEAGLPSTVYHGTTSDLESLAPDMAGAKTGNPNAVLGSFFTRDAKEASRYASDWGKNGGNVIPAHLSLQNPYLMPYSEFDDLAMEAYRGVRSDPLHDPTPYKWDDVARSRAAAELLAKHTQRAREAALSRRAELQAAGHDGIIVNQGKPTEELIVFDPGQAKSSIGNRGTFDPGDPNLTHVLVGATGLAGLSEYFSRKQDER